MARPKRDVLERFKEKFKVMESGCHEWQSNFHRTGYGKFMEGKTVPAHRMAYTLFVGPIPAGNWVLHKCDNRKCVNPEHLFLGSRKDNIQDMDQKGRRGTKCQLTEADAEKIKWLYSIGYSQQHIASRYGVYQTTISRVILGKTKLFKQIH